MKLRHSAITSSIYELVKVVEFDLTLEEMWPMRIEIFKDTEKSGHYRARLWQYEMHRIQPTFPQDVSGQPDKDHAQHILIPFEWSGEKMNNYDDIVATSPDEALE